MEIIFAALIIMLASLSGVAFIGRTAHRFLDENLPYLISFSAGVFLTTVGLLAFEALGLTGSALVAGLMVLAGYGLASLLHYLMPETHHHHDPACESHHGRHGAQRILIGDGIHNVSDGIVLASAFAISPAVGTTVMISIVIHEVLQEVSEFFILKQYGYSTRGALLVNFLVSGTILIGVGLGSWLLGTMALGGYLLGISAGFFLHVVIHDLLPRHRWRQPKRTNSFHALLVVIGIIAMTTINVAIREMHSHDLSDEGPAAESVR